MKSEATYGICVDTIEYNQKNKIKVYLLRILEDTSDKTRVKTLNVSLTETCKLF